MDIPGPVNVDVIAFSMDLGSGQWAAEGIAGMLAFYYPQVVIGGNVRAETMLLQLRTFGIPLTPQLQLSPAPPPWNVSPYFAGLR